MAIKINFKIYSLEGIDACGKSTQRKLVAEKLSQEYNLKVQYEESPSKYSIGQFLRANMSSIGREIFPLLFAADIKQTFSNVARGTQILLLDRYTDSSYVSNKNEKIGESIAFFNGMGIPNSDLTLILDIDPVVAQKRRDTEDTKDLEWQIQKRNRYMELLKSDPQRFIRIDGNKDIELVTKEIVDSIYTDFIKYE